MSSARMIASLLAAAWVMSAAPVAAQQTRAEVIAKAQAEKAAQLHPYEPSRAEVVLQRVQKAFGGPPRGLYPWFGSVLDGGLLAAGPGYRVPFGGTGAFDTQAAISLRSYKLAAATLTLPAMARTRVRASLQARLIDAPSVDFYGVGNDTTRESRTSYLFRPATVGGAVTVQAFPYLQIGGAASYLDIRSGGRVAEADSPVMPADVPGLGASPSYVVGAAHAAVDWRDGPGYNRRGGYYRVDWSSYRHQSGGLSDFHRVDVDLRQLIPIQRANWIVALRASASVTDGNVPFFLMPQLGGGGDLRGYPSWRFRDRHRVLYTAEYRWTPGQIVDMAVFHDAGKVTGSRGELGVGDLKHATGVGVRFHTPGATLVRLEAARGREGVAFIVAFGPIF